MCISSNPLVFKNWGNQELDTFWWHLLLLLYKNTVKQTELLFASKTERADLLG